MCNYKTAKMGFTVKHKYDNFIKTIYVCTTNKQKPVQQLLITN